LSGVDIPFVAAFSYLGFTLTPTASTFTKHITERRVKAVVTMVAIPDLRKLSLNTAVRLFTLKIAPVAAYGITVIWNYLKPSDLDVLNGVKATFLKRLLCLHKTTPSRLAFQIAGVPSFIEELRATYALSDTVAYQTFQLQQEVKMAEIDPDFYISPAMIGDGWKNSMSTDRHIICRKSAHGFHHRFCARREYHTADERCLCRQCGLPCTQYHYNRCTNNAFTSLRALAEG
jgi:hypothetical protein